MLAYGPTVVNTDEGEPITWILPVTYSLETDLFVNGADISSFLDNAVSAWTGAEGTNLTMASRSLRDANGLTLADVTGANVCTYLYDASICPSGPGTDGQHPIVFDADGSIVAKFFGASNRYTTLGFAGIVKYSSETNAVVKGEGVFNFSCREGFKDVNCPSEITLTDDDMEAIMTHELGHFVGCNHTQINLDEAIDEDSANDNIIPTMYAFFTAGNGANIKTLHRDDEVCVASLYPSSDFTSNTCTITGTVYDQDGKEMQCANVIARNTNSSLSKTDAISSVTGQLSAAGTFDGSFTIQGLTPGQSYSVSIESIYERMLDSSGIKPCHVRPSGYPAGEAFPPTFDSVTISTNYTCSSGNTQTSVVSSLTNVNVNPASGTPASGGTTSSSGSGGCSLIQ